MDILILPNNGRMFITKFIVKEKNQNKKVKNNNIIFPSISNKYYFCTKEKISEKITSMLKTYNSLKKSASLSRNTNNINNDSKENKNSIKAKKNDIVNYFNTNKKSPKYIKIPILKNKGKFNNIKNNKIGFNTPLINKLKNKNFFPKSEENENHNKNSNKNILNIKPKDNNKLISIIKKKKKKIIPGINKLNQINSLYFDKTYKNNSETNRFKNRTKSTQNNFNRNDELNSYNYNSLINFNSDSTQRQKQSTQRQKMPLHLSKIEKLKISILKKNSLYKRINKKDNNVLVHINGFKKHYGREENCPICITRDNIATRRVKLLSANNINFNNYYNYTCHKNCHNNKLQLLQDEISSQEFNKFFTNILKKKNNDDDILFHKKTSYNKEKNKLHKSQYSMSLSIRKNINKNNRIRFPVIYNYFES